MNQDLTSFILFALDAAIVIFIAILVVGCIRKNIFALGRWYFLEKEKFQYWQVVIGYMLLIVLLLYFRFSILPERFFILNG